MDAASYPELFGYFLTTFWLAFLVTRKVTLTVQLIEKV